MMQLPPKRLRLVAENNNLRVRRYALHASVGGEVGFYGQDQLSLAESARKLASDHTKQKNLLSGHLKRNGPDGRMTLESALSPEAENQTDDTITPALIFGVGKRSTRLSKPLPQAARS